MDNIENDKELFEEDAVVGEDDVEQDGGFAVVNSSNSKPRGNGDDSVGNRTDSAPADELEIFRRQWKREINQGATNNAISSMTNNTVNSQASEIGHKKPTEKEKSARPEKIFQIGDYENDEEDMEDKFEHEAEEDDDLAEDLEILQICKSIEGCTCLPEFTQRTTHISALPVEILTYIFKWVVSSNLDTDSLESLAVVCKSFYVLARAEDLWKLICMRTWEKNIALSSYSSFRQMFMKRPRVKFNGCYINKTTYFRNGEKSFDGLYKPMHVVHSFRYLRFYPEGTVYMLTSPKLPLNVLPDLRTRNTYVQGLLHGHYKLNNDKLSLVLKKKPDPSSRTKRYIRNSQYHTDYEQTFYIEFTLEKDGKLQWDKYLLHSCNKSSNELTTLPFEISNEKFPALRFCPVKSFMSFSDCPL